MRKKCGKLKNVYFTKLLRISILIASAPVVQWIEHWSPEPKIWVRLPAGVPVSKVHFTSVPNGEWHYLVYSQMSGMK